MRNRIAVMALVVVVLHVAGFGLLLLWTGGHPDPTTSGVGFGTGMLAYSLGLRHAFDVDHVAAIDNATRSLVARGKTPQATGFFFSLGHSSVVLVLSCLLCLGLRMLTGEVRDEHSALHRWTAVLGTTVSGSFLVLIGLANALVLLNVLGVFREMRGGSLDEAVLERHLAGRGMLSRVLGRFLSGIDATWKLYPLGLLFGLGFDTASEIALLVLSGTTVGSGMPFWAVLSLPLLFAAGMSLLDTADGVLMSRAYGWALVKPVRRVFYNLAVTGLSVFVALFVGTLQLVHLLTDQLGASGWLLRALGRIDLQAAGYLVVAAFLVVWLGSVGVWRLARIEERWSPAEDARMRS